jgi:hypothetical protein
MTARNCVRGIGLAHVPRSFVHRSDPRAEANMREQRERASSTSSAGSSGKKGGPDRRQQQQQQQQGGARLVFFIPCQFAADLLSFCCSLPQRKQAAVRPAATAAAVQRACCAAVRQQQPLRSWPRWVLSSADFATRPLADAFAGAAASHTGEENPFIAVKKQVRGVLNKITPDKFAQLSDQVNE